MVLQTKTFHFHRFRLEIQASTVERGEIWVPLPRPWPQKHTAIPGLMGRQRSLSALPPSSASRVSFTSPASALLRLEREEMLAGLTPTATGSASPPHLPAQTRLSERSPRPPRSCTGSRGRPSGTGAEEPGRGPGGH